MGLLHRRLELRGGPVAVSTRIMPVAHSGKEGVGGAIFRGEVWEPAEVDSGIKFNLVPDYFEVFFQFCIC